MPYKEYQPEKLYYSIGEVAELLGESTSLVRYWSDTFSRFVKPQRNKKGNRKYSPADVEELKKIHYLVKERRMTLEGAAAALGRGGRSVDNNAEIAERLRGVRESLLEISKSLSV
ncbi:MAG TPA: MerR family transcriptional regulator [Candidatus Coprenecus pullistercoris]|nr:MerR family transcriptional regulator [Candidatus Coprenecus pullistercoris]